LLIGNIDFANDVFKIILMDSSFVFNIDDDSILASVSAEVLADGNGYAAGLLVLDSVTEDDTNDRGSAVFDDFTWTAAGGSIGPSNGAIVYDDTTADDTIIGFIDFGTAQTATDGGTFKIANIEFRLS
jgi:hypothetical protein